jgi:hypothetical protein
VTVEIRCDYCRTEIPPELWNQASGAKCPFCRTMVWTQVFPSVQKIIRGSGAEAIGSENEASCYYHPQSRAVLACDSCGRYLCGLCDLDVAGRHLCPNCLHHPEASRQAATGLDNRRVMYDSIVLGLSIGGMVILWPSLITGPLSIILAFWFWKRPGSLVPRTRIRFILAILFSLAQCVMWFAFFWAIATQRKGS